MIAVSRTVTANILLFFIRLSVIAIVIIDCYISCGAGRGCFCCLLFVSALKVHGFVILLGTEYKILNISSLSFVVGKYPS